MGDQLLVLVGREGPLHGGDQQPVELGALHVLAHAVVGVAQVPVAELGEALDADRSQLLVTPPKAWQPLVQGEQAAHPAADRG